MEVVLESHHFLAARALVTGGSIKVAPTPVKFLISRKVETAIAGALL
jgi:hypothetical protein